MRQQERAALPPLREVIDNGRIRADDPDLPVEELADFLRWILPELPPRALRQEIEVWRKAVATQEHPWGLDAQWCVELAVDEELRQRALEAIPPAVRERQEGLDSVPWKITYEPLDTWFVCRACLVSFDAGDVKVLRIEGDTWEDDLPDGGLKLCANCAQSIVRLCRET